MTAAIIYTQAPIMPSTSPEHRSAVLIDRTATLLHKLALTYAAEAFPTLTLLDLLETETLIALKHLPAPHRTATHLANRLGIRVPTITTALSRLRRQRFIGSTDPTCTLTPQGKKRALAAQSTTHHLLRSLSQLKEQTLRDLYALLTKTLANRLRTHRLPNEPLCRSCQYFQASVRRAGATSSHCHLLDISLSHANRASPHFPRPGGSVLQGGKEGRIPKSSTRP